jgi:hypothetical protein
MGDAAAAVADAGTTWGLLHLLRWLAACMLP